MPSTQRSQLAQKEGRIILASHAIRLATITSQRKAARVYDVPRSTLQGRLQGAQTHAVVNARKRKLLLTEEQSLVY
ncbi:hypothetical protein GQ44DRAFT_702665 [Phaeosphaeriaceae sp. PMI808]|nr:hypothetical protein GQ44DRAFT_702665 [Phaeosphaeriaceae sp. PMI808]